MYILENFQLKRLSQESVKDCGNFLIVNWRVKIVEMFLYLVSIQFHL